MTRPVRPASLGARWISPQLEEACELLCGVLNETDPASPAYKLLQRAIDAVEDADYEGECSA